MMVDLDFAVNADVNKKRKAINILVGIMFGLGVAEEKRNCLKMVDRQWVFKEGKSPKDAGGPVFGRLSEAQDAGLKRMIARMQANPGESLDVALGVMSSELWWSWQ